MKRPTHEQRERMCKGKRRYRTQGDALDAAMLAGVERQRQAYRCELCGHWHLTSTGGPGAPPRGGEGQGNGAGGR